MEQKNEPLRYHPTFDSGLSTEQVEARTQDGLVNVAAQKINKSTAAIVRDNVCTLFNLFNLLIAIALAYVQAWTNLFFLFIIGLNIIIGVVQEIRGRNLVEKLSVLSSEQAHVMRNSSEMEIATETIVLDDVLVLSAGNQICADAVILEGEIEVNESLLTGESEPILKRAGDSLLSGSFVVSGKAFAQAEHVGTQNFAARLALEAKKHKRVNSDLLKSMRKVTKFTGLFILPIGILLFCEAFFLRSELLPDSVVSAAAALLGMLPKGLVLLISIALAAGVIALAKKNILVQEPYAIEALARTDVLCLDKTGTITTGSMSISSYHENPNAKLPFLHKQALGLFVGGSVDTNATAVALAEYFTPDRSLTVTSRTAFSSARKWSSATFGNSGTVILGAPERLLEHHQGTLPVDFQTGGTDGARVLFAAFTREAVADGKLPCLTIFARIELSDPIRPHTVQTLEYFRREGVAVKIISGDNPETVSLVAKRAGLADWANYVDMSSIESPEALNAAAERYTVFGRVTPSQKKQLVLALKAQGRTVAMVGDGVNDVLALREADCGIALAAGSGASKQVSQIVLTDSDFNTLPSIVEEGRRVVNNVTKVSGIFFIKTIYSVLLSVLFIIINQPFPFIPIQITLIDLAIEGYPSLFLSFERETKAIKGSFLNTAIKSALPFAILILASVCALTLIGNATAISQDELTAIQYLVLGALSASAVIKACLPPNKFRVFLAATSTIGFFVAVYLFSNLIPLLHLSLPPLQRLWIPIVVTAVSIPLIVLLNRLFRDKIKQNNEPRSTLR